MSDILVERSSNVRVEKVYPETPMRYELTLFIESIAIDPYNFTPRTVRVGQVVEGRTGSMIFGAERLEALRDLIDEFFSQIKTASESDK